MKTMTCRQMGGPCEAAFRGNKADEVIKAGQAILAADMFTFDGSLAKGRKMVGDLSKLMYSGMVWEVGADGTRH